MDLQMLMTVIVALLFITAYYSTNSKRNKILCLYSGKDKTDEEKWINTSSGYVIFRGRKFDIISRRITSFWMTRGINMIFPTKVNCLKYSWYSRFPHDPDDYHNVWETPEARNAIDTSELVTSYFKTSTPASTKKQSMLQAYLPFIILIVVVLGGFYLYTNMQTLSAHIAAMQNSLNAIKK